MHLNYRKVGVLIFSTKIAGVANTSVVWQGCISHDALDRRPKGLYYLLISCDLASTPLIKEA